MLEGEYANWALVWSRDYGAGVDMIEAVVDNYGTVRAEDVATNTAYLRTYAGVENNILNYLWGVRERSNCMSVTGKYFVGYETVLYRSIDVWRDGVQIWNRDVLLDEPNLNGLYAVTISPNGKFVAVIVTRIVSFDDQIVMLYEGI